MPVMRTNQVSSDPAATYDLTPFIEPLASYICSADRPKEALLSALSALFDEVQGTHRATLMHIATSRVESLGLAL
jgi:hypothetical protein